MAKCNCGANSRDDYPFKCKVCSRVNYAPIKEEVIKPKRKEVFKTKEEEVEEIIDNVTKLDFLINSEDE